jgi:hypothetical protein
MIEIKPNFENLKVLVVYSIFKDHFLKGEFNKSPDWKYGRSYTINQKADQKVELEQFKNSFMLDLIEKAEECKGLNDLIKVFPNHSVLGRIKGWALWDTSTVFKTDKKDSIGDYQYYISFNLQTEKRKELLTSFDKTKLDQFKLGYILTYNKPELEEMYDLVKENNIEEYDTVQYFKDVHRSVTNNNIIEIKEIKNLSDIEYIEPHQTYPLFNKIGQWLKEPIQLVIGTDRISLSQ